MMFGVKHMESGNIVTAGQFSAYLKCPTKALLLARAEKSADAFFADIERDISTAYKVKIRTISSTDFLAVDSVCRTETIFVDSETAFFSTEAATAIENGGPTNRPKLVPVFYSASDKVQQSDHFVVSFCALSIAQAPGTSIPPSGKIIFGDKERVKTVKVTTFLEKARLIVEAIVQDRRKKESPPVVINKHCPVCDFRSRCRQVATNRDDLSLLGAMTKKERAKFVQKGITTITQLSYGYRPRRRRRVRSTTLPVKSPLKHDHRLKALAIKKSQIHVVGSPALALEGTPVFVDVEGMPDRDFYYLIGLRYQKQGKAVERSLWADGPDDDSRMWREFLDTLRKIECPRLIHYGAYESRFLKFMRERSKPPNRDAAFVDRLIGESTNLISSIYGKIYFPTYENGLKDIARWLGFEWKWPQASGGGAILLRRYWELTRDRRLRDQLIAYNIEDCRAIELVADAIRHVCGNDDQNTATKLKAVNVSTLEVGFQRTFGKFSSALPDFEKVNTAAYWDYQRSKVYVRTNKLIRQAMRKATEQRGPIVVEREVIVDDRPLLCPRCSSPKIWIAVRVSHVIFDLKFSRRSIKRWAIRYHYNNFRCGECKAQMTPYRADSKYGQNLRAYIAYLLIEMRLSHERVREHLATVFDVPMLGTMVNVIKQKIAQKYEPTYRSILAQIAAGSVVHADETKGVVYGGGHYVWIFSNFTSVAYVYSPSRDASTLNEVLAGFDGVLVSDFYGAYDSMPCRQQKCLIHLMRDINEDLLKHPFNEELVFIANRFGVLLREIVATIDRHGLKKHYLKKHKLATERFVKDVGSLAISTEIGAALQKRIERNKERLFTFLDYDGVPWNNNNAEHAVRAFTRLRNGMATSTAKGTAEYCILLSVQQTLRCRGIGFLDFLRSGRLEID
jgi:predicted RecB family nuclease